MIGLRLTGAADAEAAYNRGVTAPPGLEQGALHPWSPQWRSVPTFALGHAARALLGHEACAPVDLEARLPDAFLLSVAVPTIAFAGVTRVPSDAWAVVESCAPAYGDDWWFTGLLAFVRQERGRFDEAMALACLSLDVEPGVGHSAHARAHAHYETGDHAGGLDWVDAWITGSGAGVDSLTHFSWHAALHELSMGDLTAVRLRYEEQLAPHPGQGCRSLPDAGSLLWRWALTPGSRDVPGVEAVLAVVDPRLLESPATPFMAMHAAVVLCAAKDADGLARLARGSARRTDGPDGSGATHREVVAPLALALRTLVCGDPSGAADALGALAAHVWRLEGSEAQREVVEETRICALVAAGRCAEALVLLDRRLDRRPCLRDRWWQAAAQVTEIVPPDTATFFPASGD